MSAGIVNVMYLVDVKNTGMENEKNRTEMEKPDISELFRAHGFFGPPAGEEQNEGKSIEETDYLTAVDSLLSSVKPEPVDMGDEAILRRLRSTTEFLKEYQEAINRADNLELSEDEGEDEVAAEEVGEAAGDVLGIPVPTVSAEAEELLRGARTLHRQTAELRSFLKDLLLEDGQGDGVRAPSCPEMEESTVDKDAEAEKIREERLKAYAEKKAKKPALIAKSSIVLYVKPCDDETDMKEMENKVRSITMDGLVWGASKLVPDGYGINKLQIMCVVEDEKVSVDLLVEEIQNFEDHVQSVDAAFNKI